MEFQNFRETVFPRNLKLADISPAYKKKDLTVVKKNIYFCF